MHLVCPPVSLPLAACVDPEVFIVCVRIVDVTVDVHIFELFVVTLVDAEPPHRVRHFMGSSAGRRQVSKRDILQVWETVCPWTA